MTTLREFRCEICGTVSSNPVHWFVIHCGDSELSVHSWSSEVANAAGARITAAKPMPRSTSAAGSSQFVPRRSQILNRQSRSVGMSDGGLLSWILA